MSKKRILIPGWSTGETTFGVKKDYLEYISYFGTPVILTPDDDEIIQGDLLFLPGGLDVAPHRYGQYPRYQTGSANVALEAFDTMMLPKYIEAGIPIVGVCRGMQTLAVHFGGTLTQHIYGHETSTYDSEGVHDLYLPPDFAQYRQLITGKVNSRHHQVVNPKTLPEELQIIAYYGKNGNGKNKDFFRQEHPEAMIHREKQIYAVQWHPENCANDQLTPWMIRSFLGTLPK